MIAGQSLLLLMQCAQDTGKPCAHWTAPSRRWVWENKGVVVPGAALVIETLGTAAMGDRWRNAAGLQVKSTRWRPIIMRAPW